MRKDLTLGEGREALELKEDVKLGCRQPDGHCISAQEPSQFQCLPRNGF